MHKKKIKVFSNQKNQEFFKELLEPIQIQLIVLSS